jgi:class 3 adenylate cyclase
VASPEDLEALGAALRSSAVFSPGQMESLSRVYAWAMSRVAQAEAAAARSVLVNNSLHLSGDEEVTAREWEASAALLPGIGRLLDVVHRHQLEATMRMFEASASDDLSHRRLIRLAVGFFDLSGFTTVSGRLATEDLAELLVRYESAAIQVAAEYGGTVVKFIGDSAMIVAPRPADLAEIAFVLVGDPGEEREMAVRAGLAYGELLAQEGDFFGVPVNCAARLVAAAEPGTVLAEQSFTAAMDPRRVTIAPQEARALRGFAEPVASSLLSRAASPLVTLRDGDEDGGHALT